MIDDHYNIIIIMIDDRFFLQTPKLGEQPNMRVEDLGELVKKNPS